MKRFISFILVIALLTPLTATFSTADAIKNDVASYIESQTGDTITVKSITPSPTVATQNTFSTTAYTAQILRNNVIEKTLYIDFLNNTLCYQYPDGTTLVESLSNVVTITKIPPLFR